MDHITVEILKAHDACEEQVAQFAAHFPEGLAITLENFQRAQSAGLDVFWCVQLLDAPARAECDRVTAPALVAALQQTGVTV